MVSVQIWLAAAGSDPRATAHNLLHTLTGDPTLTHTPAGRPQVPGWSVSITHTHHLVAVAAALTGPIGVDMEELHPRDFAPLADRWFHQQELQWLSDQPDALRAFLQLWTAKEAVGKALGLGLRQSGLRRQMPLPADPAGRGDAEEAEPPDRQALRAGEAARGGERPMPGEAPGIGETAGPPGRTASRTLPPWEALSAGAVPGEPGLIVVHVPVEGAVLALAGPTRLAEVVVHEVALRRVEGSRTSFPVVVRGN